MSYTKVKIYNLALSALLLTRQVSDIDSDTTTNEVRVLNQFWDHALSSTLQAMDLDSLSEPIELELLAELDTGPWGYAYKYPSRCAFLRRLQSCVVTDNSSTHIPKKVALYNDKKAIYTNEYQAIAECIPTDISLANLSVNAGLAIAYKLAQLSTPLIVGKGAKTLREEIYQMYLLAVNDAREHDKLENFNYDTEEERSEYVRVRLE